MATGPDLTRSESTRALRARILLLLGTLAAGFGIGLLLVGTIPAGLVTLGVSVAACAAGLATGTQPNPVLARRMRQAPALGLLVVGGVSALGTPTGGAWVALALGVAVLVGDALLVRRQGAGDAGSRSDEDTEALAGDEPGEVSEDAVDDGVEGEGRSWSLPSPRSLASRPPARREADPYGEIDPYGDDNLYSDAEYGNEDAYDEEPYESDDLESTEPEVGDAPHGSDRTPGTTRNVRSA